MISIIVAYDDNRIIGYKGQLPWYHKDDLAYFKKITEHHACLMGRVTFESILNRLKTPLPNRENIVVSRQPLYCPGVKVIHQIDEFLSKHATSDEEIFVIGGHQIYEITLPLANRLYITHIKGSHEGDVYFPEIDFTHYVRVYNDEQDHLTFSIYERKI